MTPIEILGDWLVMMIHFILNVQAEVVFLRHTESFGPTKVCLDILLDKLSDISVIVASGIVGWNACQMLKLLHPFQIYRPYE